MVRSVLLTLAILAGAPACSEPRSSRCETICRREADCAEQASAAPEVEVEVDEGECVEQCRRLERDPDGATLVEAHARCLTAAPTCQAVLACD
jgi:hypothetical protein